MTDHHFNHLPDIEHIEQRRQPNRDMDAIYLLTPEPHIVDCLLADLDRRRYRKASVLWTACTMTIPRSSKMAG